MSANRKGWLLFDSKSRKLRTTFHCNFDETLEGRRCALRDFALRQRKAGPGATRDDERLARLEGELYDDTVNIDIVEDPNNEFHEMPVKFKAAAPEGVPVKQKQNMLETGKNQFASVPVLVPICFK